MNISVSQALASGLPVIATRHSGLPEQVLDGVNGILVREGDYEALAQAIVHIIEHPERWATYGQRGRAHVVKHYDQDASIERQIRLYNELTNEN